MNAGDTAFVLISAALVMFMTPGLAIFYGGMVRRKNVLSILMQCMVVMCLISLHWVLFGYSLAFAPGNGLLGGLRWFGLSGVGLEPYADYGATIPHQAFMVFQAMFAVITPAIVVGAFAERMKFSAFLVFILLWETFVYCPVAHAVWGVGGFLRNLGVLDFAGGNVVEINSGIAALACALVVGPRRGYAFKPTPPHNLPLTVLGAGVLWFGWFGFNAGSALAANGVAVNAFVTTNTAAAAAGLAWAALEWLLNEKPNVFGTITGAVAGMVAITPAAGFVTAVPAILIGLVAGLLCFVAVGLVKPRLGYDDSLDAFGVHGVGGIWGTLATGLFASKAVNSAGADGLFCGNPRQFLIQAAAVCATIVFVFVMTVIVLKAVDAMMGLRASEKDEIIGLDLSQHHEGAYTLME